MAVTNNQLSISVCTLRVFLAGGIDANSMPSPASAHVLPVIFARLYDGDDARHAGSACPQFIPQIPRSLSRCNPGRTFLAGG